jgi:hypothetical protein
MLERFSFCSPTWPTNTETTDPTWFLLLRWALSSLRCFSGFFAVYILPSVGGGYAVLMGLQIANTAGYTKRSVASSGLYIGYCLGNFVGPLCFKKGDAPRFEPGFIVVVVTSIIAGLLALVYRGLCMWSNSKRDKSGTTEGFDHAYEDDLTDKKVSHLLFFGEFYTDQLEHAIPVHPLIIIVYAWLSCVSRDGYSLGLVVN